MTKLVLLGKAPVNVNNVNAKGLFVQLHLEIFHHLVSLHLGIAIKKYASMVSRDVFKTFAKVIDYYLVKS